MENLTDKELELALKLNKHKIFLQRFFIFFLFFVNLLIMYNLWYRWVIYSSQTPEFLHDQPTHKTLINFAEYHERNKPIPLAIGEQNYLASGTRSYDYYAIIRNPNLRWLGSRIVLEFRFPTETIPKTLENVLPGESRLIAVFGRSSNGPDAFIVEVKDTSWKRLHVDPPVVSDWIRALNPYYETSSLSPDYLETIFALTNVSTFGFWKVPYTILLYNGDSLVGLNELVTARLDPGEVRLIKTLWSGQHVRPDRIDITINPSAVYDEQNRYLPGQ